VTALEKETFPLFVNTGGGQFVDKTSASGISMESFQMSGWSNAIADLDNDGWKDLTASRSNVQDNVATYSPRKFEEPMVIFRNLSNGKFQNVSQSAGPDFQKASGHRGLAVGDLDNDGRLDLVATALNGTARVLHNTSAGGNHWLLLKLEGTKSNRLGIGAKVKVTTEDGLTLYNHATTSTGYASSSDPRVHFGLGKSAKAKEIEVTWPSGAKQVLRDVAADRVLTVAEP
jgi:enediyne biosynthesis protein E4